MYLSSENRHQAGFTIFEMIVAISLMLVVSGVVFSLMKDSMKVAFTTYEMADAQQGLRTAHEYINRDLMNSGDGLNSINNIRIARNFVTNYLTLSPIDDPSAPGVANLGILTSDNDTAANTQVRGTNPVDTVRSIPVATDRMTVLQIDPNFVPMALPANAVSSNGRRISISPADVSRFRVGEIYFISSTIGATFGTLTNITTAPALEFRNGDVYGLNLTGTGGYIETVTAGGTLPTSLMRIRVIHYYVNSRGNLMRRVFGVQGAGFTDSLIAEHIVGLQFRYFMNLRDAGGNVMQPQQQLTTSQQQLAITQVEVTITAETPRTINNGSRQEVTMTTSTSVRNMQFREALQPTAGG